LKELSVIKDTLKYIEISKGAVINISDIDRNDNDTFELIQSGDVADVFLLDTDDITEFLKAQNPKSIEQKKVTSPSCFSKFLGGN
jgi:DNA polymerase III alpha subunit